MFDDGDEASLRQDVEQRHARTGEDGLEGSRRSSGLGVAMLKKTAAGLWSSGSISAQAAAVRRELANPPTQQPP